MPGRRTILMVEDEESITVPLAEALAREGFDTEVAGTASEALELARRVNPDLVLLDVMLPDGSGYDVCRALRADSRVPIIMLTLAARRPIGWSDSSSEPTTTSSSRSAPARWPPGSGRSFAVRVGRRPSPATAPSSSAS